MRFYEFECTKYRKPVTDELRLTVKLLAIQVTGSLFKKECLVQFRRMCPFQNLEEWVIQFDSRFESTLRYIKVNGILKL